MQDKSFGSFFLPHRVVVVSPKTKFQLVKRKEICIQNIYSDTRVLSLSPAPLLESSCYDKLILFLVFVCVSMVFFCRNTLSNKRNCTRMDKFTCHESLCRFMCEMMRVRCFSSSFSFFYFGNATSCTFEKSSIFNDV